MRQLWTTISTPLLTVVTALALGGVVIGVSSGSLSPVGQAYGGLFEGALLKPSGLSESLVATVPYIFTSLAVALAFQAGLFNIGVEGQFQIGALCAAYAGVAVAGLPPILHLPLTLLAAALGGAVWAAIPGILKVKTGAHEVINTIMMNYVAFRLIELLVSGPLRDPSASTVQTARVSPYAELWSLAQVPERMADPVNALLVAVICAALTMMLVSKFRMGVGAYGRRGEKDSSRPYAPTPLRPHVVLLLSIAVGLLAFFALPPLLRVVWFFHNPRDRLHVGLFVALGAAVGVWWLLKKTTVGFELRTVGRNPAAAQYGGMNIGRSVVAAMALSGALAGVGGAVEVIGVSTCRCLPLFFSSGYGFDSIAIALLARLHPLGILPASFLFGAMHNGADLMEIRSGVSKSIIAVIQAIVLLLVAAPSLVRWLYRLRTAPHATSSVTFQFAPLAYTSTRPHARTFSRWFLSLLGVLVVVSCVVILRTGVGSQSGGQFLTDTFAQALRVAAPIALAAFCGLLCERSGIINIGIEGMMLMAAMVAYTTNIFAFAALQHHGLSHQDAAHLSRMLGLVGALAAGGLLALLHGGVSISLKADQIISGTVINILALGATGFVYRQFLAEGAPPSPGAFAPFDVPLLSSLPVIGPILFRGQKPIVGMMLTLTLLLHYMLFRTVWGLRLRAVGEHPQAADTAGVSVLMMRYLSVIAGGIVAGLGGAWFTLESVDVFQPLMTNGLGFVGLAAMIFGRWSPLGALVGAFVFGLGSSLQTTVSILYPQIPSQLPQMLPYLLTMIVLAGVVGRATPPAALGKEYPSDG